MTYRAKMSEAYARVQWCKKIFGPSFQGIPEGQRKWNQMRWWRNKGYLYFRNEDDYIMYRLAWS
jgi:hypothetical protein